MFRRELLGSYAFVGGGLAAGLYVGIFVVDARPAFLGWIFGGAAGLTLGAFIAALAAGEALAGSGYKSPPTEEELAAAGWDDDDEWEDEDYADGEGGEPPAP